MCMLNHSVEKRQGPITLLAEYNPDEARDTHGRWSSEEDIQTREKYLDPNGHYIADRIKLHDAAIEKYEHRPPQENPVIQLIAGGIASGKTTSAQHEYDKLRQPAIVNVDEVRKDLPEFEQIKGTNKSGLLQEEASDIKDKILLSALGHNNDIALDAVGSKDLANKLSGLEDVGYKVNVAYVHRPIAEAINLANSRATNSNNPADKGRFIAPEVVEASHAKARNALAFLLSNNRDIKIYDGTNHYDRTKPVPVIYQRENGKVLVKNNTALERMRTSESPTIPDIF